MKKEKELKLHEIELNMKVKDDDGDVGIITEIKDSYNISVKYEKGFGLFCLNECCDDKLFKN